MCVIRKAKESWANPTVSTFAFAFGGLQPYACSELDNLINPVITDETHGMSMSSLIYGSTILDLSHHAVDNPSLTGPHEKSTVMNHNTSVHICLEIIKNMGCRFGA